MKKRLLGILLSFALMLTMMPMMTQTAFAGTASVSFGKVTSADNITAENIGKCTFNDAKTWVLANWDNVKSTDTSKWINIAYSDGIETLYFRFQSDWYPLNTIQTGIPTTIDNLKGYENNGDDVWLCTPVPYPLWVGGTQVTSANASNIPAPEGRTQTGKASYDAETNTLTLNGYSSSNVHRLGDEIQSSYTIYATDSLNNLTIELSGENSLINPDYVSDYADGISVDGNLTIKGQGKLTVSSKNRAIFARNCEIENGQIIAESKYAEAIKAYTGDVTINGGTVKATVNEGNGTDAIYGAGNVIITGADTIVTAETRCNEEAGYCTGICADNGKAEISGGTVTATVSGSELYDCDAIYAEEDISITGGDVTATVTGGDNGCDAICADEGDVAISGDGTKVTATATSGDGFGFAIFGNNVSVTNGSDVSATSASYAILAEKIKGEGGNVTIDCSKVAADGTYVGVLAYGNIDIKDSEMKDTKGQIWTPGKLTVQDSRVSATASSDVLFGRGGVDIKYTGAGKYSTYVEAIANGLEQSGVSTNDAGYKDVAIHAAKGKLDIGDNLSITKPKGGAKGDYGEGDREFTTVLYDGKPAGHVIIEVAKPAPTPAPTPAPAANPLTVTTTAKPSAKSMTVKWTWNSVAGANKYKVSYHKVGSKKWTTKTTKKTKYVVKGHKFNGLYEYKVAAVTASGDVWSDVNCRYFKRVKATAKAGKTAGTVKASWKTDKGATGYKVLLATNKKMNNAQAVEVSADQKSYTFSGLKSGKKYYVKVRPLKNYGGVTYQGIYTKALRAKTK